MSIIFSFISLILLGVLVGTPLVIAITAWLLQKLIGNRQNEETES